jgi:hypothetical protein
MRKSEKVQDNCESVEKLVQKVLSCKDEDDDAKSGFEDAIRESSALVERLNASRKNFFEKPAPAAVEVDILPILERLQFEPKVGACRPMG